MSATQPPSEPDEQMSLFSTESAPPSLAQPKKKRKSKALTVADVLADPSSLNTERLDMRKALTAAIKRKGGTQQAYVVITASIYLIGFGHPSASLFYAAYNLPPNSRADLPSGVLRVLVVYEFAVMKRLDSHVMEAIAQPDIDEELDDQAKLAIRATKRFLYWLDYGKTLPGS